MSGTFSDGLSTNALPSVSAIGNIHIGTIAGKLKGVMPTTTPSGSRRYSHVTPRETSSAAAVVEVRQAEGVLHDLEAALETGAGLRRRLAGLERDRVRELRRVPGHEVVEPPERKRAVPERRRRPGRERAAGRVDRGGHIVCVREPDRTDDASRVRAPHLERLTGGSRSPGASREVLAHANVGRHGERQSEIVPAIFGKSKQRP